MASKKVKEDNGDSRSADDSTKLARLRELVSILEGSASLTSLDYEDADIVVRLSRGGPAHSPMVVHTPAVTAASAMHPAPISPPTTTAVDSGSEVVKSPFVGTFYRAASPTATPFTEVGARVTPKQVLCIVEAMKLMNEIECEVGGTILEIIPENGQPVQYGDPLFRIAVDK
ncbi:MAG: acetyl-CoA carboxylase biotin carboxyl carrier protein [Myxococcales bacterium]|nr:acetyl-CoA carboxylase biotin carboxyl carrier protein [Myxococcales bacterium]